MKRYVIAVAAWLLVTSCRTDASITPTLTGDWVWLVTSGGFTGGQTSKPGASERIILRFGTDQRLTVIRDGDVLFGGTYSLTTKRSIYTGKDSQAINIQTQGPYPNQSPRLTIDGVITKLTANELEIADNAYDGYGSSYRRAE